MAEDKPQTEEELRFLEEILPQEKMVESLLEGFKSWVQQYKRVVIDESPPMAQGDIPIASDKQTQSSQLEKAFLDAWEIIITKVVSPENIEQVRNTLDDLMGDYDFLERKLRGRFGINYGLEGFKTRSTKKKPKDYEPRKLHTKLILSQVKNGTSTTEECWNNLIYEGKNGNLIVDGNIVEIYPEGKKNEAMKLKSKRIDEYEIDYETFARNFSYILNK